jgi:hypothetical protein
VQAYEPKDECRSVQACLLVRLQGRYPAGGDLGPRRCRGYDVHECRDGLCSLALRAANNFVQERTAGEWLRHCASVRSPFWRSLCER